MASESLKIVRPGSLKSTADFRRHLAELGVEIPCDDAVVTGEASPLLAPVPGLRLNGRAVGNRIAVHPMEGWDGTTEGGVTEDMRRRWRRFGESGGKLICGGEAMAVRPAKPMTVSRPALWMAPGAIASAM